MDLVVRLFLSTDVCLCAKSRADFQFQHLYLLKEEIKLYFRLHLMSLDFLLLQTYLFATVSKLTDITLTL